MKILEASIIEAFRLIPTLGLAQQGAAWVRSFPIAQRARFIGLMPSEDTPAERAANADKQWPPRKIQHLIEGTGQSSMLQFLDEQVPKVSEVVDRVVFTLLTQALDDYLERQGFRGTLGVRFREASKHFACQQHQFAYDLEEVIQRRNDVAHNGGEVTEEYLSGVRYPGLLRSRWRRQNECPLVGTAYSFDLDYLYPAALAIWELAEHVEASCTSDCPDDADGDDTLKAQKAWVYRLSVSNPIEDPIAAARRQFPPHSNNPLFDAALAAIDKEFSPLGSSIKALVERFVSNQPERLAYFIEVAMNEIQRHQHQLDIIQHRLSGPEWTETLLVALERVTHTQSRERIERFGRVFGAALSGGQFNWEEAQALLYDLERLTSQDIEVLRGLSIDDGSNQTKGKLDIEFQSQCGRLVGFGLVVAEVETRIGTSAQIYSVSPRGRCLLAALSGEMPPQAD